MNRCQQPSVKSAQETIRAWHDENVACVPIKYCVFPDGNCAGEWQHVVPDGKQTGYRSHFHHEEALSEYSDARACVLAWLDHEAKTLKWKAYVESRQQLSLF